MNTRAWEVFWTINSLIWPLYVGLLAVYLLFVGIVWLNVWRNRHNDS